MGITNSVTLPLKLRRRWDCRWHTGCLCFSLDFPTSLCALQSQGEQDQHREKYLLSKSFPVSLIPDRAQYLLGYPRSHCWPLIHLIIAACSKSRIIWAKSGRLFLGEGAACKDLEVRQNMADSGNLLKLRSTGESNKGRRGVWQGWRGPVLAGPWVPGWEDWFIRRVMRALEGYEQGRDRIRLAS